MSELIGVPDVASWLRDRLLDLGLAHQASALLGLFGKDLAEGYRELARCVLRERLDRFILNYDLGTELALPPRNCPAELASAFGRLPIDQEQAGLFPVFLLKLLGITDREFRGGAMQATALTELVLQDWPDFYERMQTVFENNPGIASESLIDTLDALDCDAAASLATRMGEYLANAHCEQLPANAPIKQVVRWSESYFRYAIGAFERGHEPDDAVSTSFANWVGSQVIGATRFLFAPLPTITEIGKVAVMTGRNACEQSSDYEGALRERYAEYLPNDEAFQFVKNWTGTREPLHPSTRLLVHLENRIDDDLHKCTDFSHHQERVRTICEQLADQIGRWLLDARRFQREIAVFITADHGATKLSRLEEPLLGTTPVERRILEVSADFESCPDDFFHQRTSPDGGGYLIPYARVAYQDDRAMLHGGLTPEEVLIPFVRVGPGSRDTKGALQLRAVDGRGDAVRDGWHIWLQLENTSPEAFVNVQIRVLTPFAGKHSIQSLAPFVEPDAFIMMIKSEFEQTGRTRVAFELRYRTKSDAPFDSKRIGLDIELAPHLVERDEASRDLDDAFD